MQIASKNPPVAAPTWNSGAGTIHDDAAAIIYEDVATINNAAAVAALRAGTNVLAIQGLNSGVNSSDFLQRFKLDGEISNQTAYSGPIAINSPVTIKARTLDSATGKWSPLTEGTMVHIDAGDANRLRSAAGIRILGGQCPPDPALYAALASMEGAV